GSGAERALVVHNLSASTLMIPIPMTASAYETIHADQGVALVANGIVLPPHSGGAWQLR
ncbi:MAG: hypothetical protein ACXW28_10915, partial [Thermoanaerobaculia bacterium]